MSTPSENPYAPPRTEAAAEDRVIDDKAAKLEVLRLAIRSSILGVLAFLLSPFFFGALLAPFGILASIQAKNLIEKSGAGENYRSAANGGFFFSCCGLVVSIGMGVFMLVG